MKNLSKILLLCMLILPNFLAAQKKKIKQAHLIGTWAVVKIGNETNAKGTLVFNEDKTFFSTDQYNPAEKKGTWELDAANHTLQLKPNEESKTFPITIESLTKHELQLRDTDAAKSIITLKKVDKKGLEAYWKDVSRTYSEIYKEEPKEEAIKEAYKEPINEEPETAETETIIELPKNFPLIGTWIAETPHKTQIILVFLAEGLFVQAVQDTFRKGTWTLDKNTKVISFQYDDGRPASFEVLNIQPKEMQCKDILTQYVSIWKKQ